MMGIRHHHAGSFNHRRVDDVTRPVIKRKREHCAGPELNPKPNRGWKSYRRGD